MILLYTFLAILFILYIGYKIYTDFSFLTKKKTKYNKSADAANWYLKTRFVDRFIYGKAEGRKYKILREDDEKETNSGV